MEQRAIYYSLLQYEGSEDGVKLQDRLVSDSRMEQRTIYYSLLQYEGSEDGVKLQDRLVSSSVFLSRRSSFLCPL
jgi:hypothetical protein